MSDWRLYNNSHMGIASLIEFSRLQLVLRQAMVHSSYFWKGNRTQDLQSRWAMSIKLLEILSDCVGDYKCVCKNLNSSWNMEKLNSNLNLPWQGCGVLCKFVASKSNPSSLSVPIPALSATSFSIWIAVGLRSETVALQEEFAFNTGRILEPHPHPISTKCWQGSDLRSSGNSKSKYLRDR